ncbi:DUF3958 family protein [Enterococcus sp. LJL128]|uniref:DUF3958 family protein n=1 Tax=Enterococcus sp. LJL51 TaxID=3416656 RepID=UPI003CF9A754
MKTKDELLFELEQEENRVANAHYKAEQTEREMNRIQEGYEGIFHQSSHLFFKLEEMFHESRSKPVFDEICTEVKMEQERIFERMEEEKDILIRRKKEFESRENEIYYEKRRMMVRLEDI